VKYITIALLAVLALVGGCGSDSGVTGKLGSSLTVGPLTITPTKLSDRPDIGVIDADVRFEPENGLFVAVRMRWENTGDAPVTDFPTAQIVNADGLVYEATTLCDPEPSLMFDMVNFAIPPGAAKEGWLTFDIAGTPAKLIIYVSGDSPDEPESATWEL